MANIEIDKRNTEFTPSGGAEVPQTVGSREPSRANVWAKFPQVRTRLTARDQAVLAPGFQVVLCGYATMRMGSLPNSGYFRAYPELRLRDAEYDPELLARIFLLSRRERWRRFSRWLHTYFGCRCQRQPRHLIRQFRRLVVADVMAMCRQVIHESQLVEPNDRTVRNLARIFLRNVRRRRIRGVGFRDAIRKTPLCLRRLEFFLERRLPKMISKST